MKKIRKLTVITLLLLLIVTNSFALDIKYGVGSAAIVSDGTSTGITGLLLGDGATVTGTTAPTLTGLGVGAAPLSSAGAYVNNAAGPGVIIKAGSSSGSRPISINQNSSGTVTSMVDSAGAEHFVTYLVVSGDFSASVNGSGVVSIANSGQSSMSYMIEARSDVEGSALIASTPIANHSLNIASLDGGTAANASNGTATRNINFAVDNDGKLRWGSSAGSSTGTRVGSVTVTAGSSCTSAPTITPSGGGCTDAGTYVAFVSGGQLKRVEIVTPGYGCTSAPSLAVSGGGGCTGTATAVLMDVALARSGANALAITGIGGAGTLSVESLKTPGAATGKNVVCADTSTGILYVSSTGTDCTN